jgi:hypothetical protein
MIAFQRDGSQILRKPSCIVRVAGVCLSHFKDVCTFEKDIEKQFRKEKGK